VIFFYHSKRCRTLITCDSRASTCVLVGLKDVQRFSAHLLQVSFGHCRPLAASQVTGRNDMEVPHKFAQPWITLFHIFWCLLETPKTCSFAGSIKLCCMLTGFFWDTVDSFAGLFDGFYNMFTSESTSKADKFEILGSMKILNTPLTQKRSGIRKRH